MYRLFIVAAVAAGCGAGLEGPEGSGRSALGEGEAQCSPGQMQVCHQGESRCVGEGALDAHLDHGDAEGPCNPIGTPPVEDSPAWMPAAPLEPHQLDEGPLLQSGNALRAGVALPAWLPGTPTPPAQLEEASAEAAPDWTPQAPNEPALLCGAEVGDPCGGALGDCCAGLRCEWSACVPE